MMLSKGKCHGVFLLCHAHRFSPRQNIDEWVEAARQRSTFMAFAVDLQRIAIGLIRLGLVECVNGIVVDQALSRLSMTADRATLVAIAKLLILTDPPLWLRLAVNDGEVAREYIPQQSLTDLEWIEPELDQFLIEIRALIPNDNQNALLKKIGDVAELVVLAGLRLSRADLIHVSKISDAYGYDIECAATPRLRYEVKGASEKTQGRFHISRNEFDKSVRYGQEWRLVQVIFSNDAFFAWEINAKHVKGIRELQFSTLQKLVPPDTSEFKWTESAFVVPPPSSWTTAKIPIASDFSAPGFRLTES